MPILLVLFVIASAWSIYMIEAIAPKPMTDEQIIEETHKCENAGLTTQVTYRTSDGVMSMQCAPKDLSTPKK